MKEVCMKKTLKEKMLSKIKKMTKKHPMFKYPALILVILVVFVFDTLQYFSNNTKRYVSMISVLFIFALSSSFTYLDNQNLEMKQSIETSMQEESINEYDFQNQEDQMNKPDAIEDSELILEDDILKEYDNEDVSEIDNITTFTVDEILEENKETVANDLNQSESNHNELSDEDLVRHIVETTVFDKDDWKLLLINKQHPVPDDYEFSLGTIKGSMMCDERIVDELLAMLQAAKEDQVNLIICSPYRDYNRQEVLFERKVKAYMQKGYSYLEAYSYASQTVTVPGASEHQIGLAFDIISDEYASLNAGFGETIAGKWLAENCCEFGFILRYPLGKEYITSIEYEPWHFRYVGVEAATIIMKTGITLEEFVQQIEE